MKYLPLILTSLITLTAVIGDHLVFNTPYSSSFVYRGFVDNFVHAAIGLLSSLLFLKYDPSHAANAVAFNVAVCTVVSSLIDFDHAIVARSINWKDLKNFSRRGVFHCSTVWFAVSILIIAWSQIYKRINYNIVGWMLLIAFTSHHIRDAHRRGFWIWPYGHTQAISKGAYVFLIAMLPSVYYLVYRKIKPGMLRYSTIDYSFPV